ncbi:MAG: thiamine ABC transporter substrate binding subunit [Chromatiales bacterium]|jgi:thiamine transport system substrate-binding protein|nr:thiamine ABC transporter substrate binding subunit [Chromatiales bacterium]
MRHLSFITGAAIVCALASILTTPALAADKPKLVVYAYDSFTSKWGPGPTIEKNFEAQCGCDLEWVSLDSSGTVLSRLQLEGANAKADVAIGVDSSLMGIAAATGLFAPHNADTSGLRLPIEWNHSTFLPFDWGHFAFIYDTERMTTPPASFDALIALPKATKIVIQDPRSSTPGLGLLLWVKSVYGDDAPRVWKALAPKILTVTKGWWEAYSMFLKGEADMVLSYTTSPAYHVVAESKTNYAAAAFGEGHYMQIEVAGKLRAAPNPELADKFMNFILTDGFQSAIPTGNWMFPATGGVDMPAAFNDLVRPSKNLLMSADVVRANRKAWTREWLNSMAR